MKKLILLFLLITSIAYSQELRTAIKALDPSDFSGGKFIQESNGAFVPKTLAELRGYKVYTALLTQTGENAPVATVLQNDIGEIVWTRNTAGNYIATLSGAFPTNKTNIENKVLIWINSVLDDVDQYIMILKLSGDAFSVTTVSEGTATDGIISGFFIEIRVYP